MNSNIETPLVLILAVSLTVMFNAPLRAPADPVPATQTTSVPDESTLLNTLRTGHPRLILLPDDVARIKSAIATDPVAQGYYAKLERDGTKILTQPPVERVLIGPRLLDVSRKVLDRIYTLGLLYRLDGDHKWSDRATVEMLAVANFTDWHPPHFLDVAEMTHAMAIGYDWFYDALSPQDRDTIEKAIVEKGLEAGKTAHATGQDWWANNPYNWNLVCNGGLSVGALAVADQEPDLAKRILERAITGMPHALNSYAPDGAWEEGPGYWAYATQYAVAGISAMDTALGTDFGLSDAPGLNDAGLFRIQSVGPTGLFFNFADAGEKAGDEPSLFWLATRFHQPLLAWAARQAADKHSSARDLIWYSAAGDGASLVKDGLDAQFVHANVVFMRSSWTDPNALYVGFKGGDNKANHAHLDLGTFVFDALGQRWVSDLGPDDYNLPGYFGKQRWDYYRLGTEGQNTLLIDGQNQNLKAEAPLIGYGSEPDGAFAIADLSDGYSPDHALQVHRGVALVKNRTELLVQDEIQILKPDAVKPFDLRWAIHTRAQIAVDLTGASATLTQKGQTVVARILAPAGATFVSEPVEIPAPQRPAPGVSRLAIHLAGVAGETRIAVVFLPQIGSQPGMSPTVTPLSGWNATHWH